MDEFQNHLPEFKLAIKEHILYEFIYIYKAIYSGRKQWGQKWRERWPAKRHEDSFDHDEVFRI